MIYHVYALSWNESRLLPLFFRHYHDADKIYILDNKSDDNSIEIIMEHGADIIPFDTDNEFDDEMHQLLKNNCWKKSKNIADYVIVQDLDEFLFFPEYPNDIKTALSKINVDIFRTKCYHMVCQDSEIDNLLSGSQNIISSVTTGSDMIVKSYSKVCYDKILCFNPNKLDETGYSLGAHKCKPVSENVLKWDTESALMLHYKFTGKEYMKQRYKMIRDRNVENCSKGRSVHYSGSDQEIDQQIQDYYNFPIDSLFEIMYGSNITNQNYRGRQYILDGLDSDFHPRVTDFIFRKTSNSCYIDVGSDLGTCICIAALSGCSQVYVVRKNPEQVKNTVKLNGWKNINFVDMLQLEQIQTQHEKIILKTDNLQSMNIKPTSIILTNIPKEEVPENIRLLLTYFNNISILNKTDFIFEIIGTDN